MAAKGTAAIAIDVDRRIDAVIIEVEVVGAVSVRVGLRRPVIAVLTNVVEQLIVSIEIPVSHKEEGILWG